MSDERVAVRNQFVEGIKDSALTRELCKMVRLRPGSALLEVRQEAIAWSLEDRPSNTRVAKNRSVLCDTVMGGGQCTGSAKENASLTLDEILKVVTEQGKAIGELANVVRQSVTLRERPNKGWRIGRMFEFTDDGKPICFKCIGNGDIARECKLHKPRSKHTASDAFFQVN